MKFSRDSRSNLFFGRSHHMNPKPQTLSVSEPAEIACRSAGGQSKLAFACIRLSWVDPCCPSVLSARRVPKDPFSDHPQMSYMQYLPCNSWTWVPIREYIRDYTTGTPIFALYGPLVTLTLAVAHMLKIYRPVVEVLRRSPSPAWAVGSRLPESIETRWKRLAATRVS